MAQPRFHLFLRKQIYVMIMLSVFPGLGYIFLGWLYDIHALAIVWYVLIVVLSIWGMFLHREYKPEQMGKARLENWYTRLSIFYYLFFILWLLIYVIYVRYDEYNLHYIAIFTQIGATTVSAVLLYPDRRLYGPIIPVMIVPLMIYFAGTGEWYGYVLSLFSATLGWVLYYGATGSNKLLYKTHFQASHDMLTGLVNRHYFIEQLQQTLFSLKETKRFSYLLLIDLDHFKTVNDSLGHDVGDRLLQEVSSSIRANLPESSMLARLGGDEFIILGNETDKDSASQHDAQVLAETILKSLKQTYIINEHHIYISASIGIRLIAPEHHNANSLIREADIAMYEVKATGRNAVFLFNEAISQRVKRHLEIERLLHFALEENEIVLHFQPQFDTSKRVIGAEVLARWNSSSLGKVSPVEFIPIAEQTGLIVEIGEYLLDTAFRQLRVWQEKGIELDQLSINISIRQFIHQDFVSCVKQLCEKYLDINLQHKLVFEITESVVAEDIGRVITIMQELNECGIRFSMDDFGTGYSSLNYLKQLPIDEIKIDRSFIRDIVTDDDDKVMIISILSMARFFGLTVVAEGVETIEQFNFLQENRCQIYQGYLMSRPLPADVFEQFVKRSV